MQGRRGFLQAAGGLTAAAALAGCSSPVGQAFTGSAGPASQLDFWHPFTGGDGEQLLAMLADFRKRHQHPTLKPTTMVWGAPYYTKLTLATLGGRPPQVAITHLSKLPTLAASGLLRPISDGELAEHDLAERQFQRRAWRNSQYEGKQYAIPLDTHPLVFYYRTDIAQRAGLLDSQGKLPDIDGPEKFRDALRAVKEVTGEWGCSVASTKDPAMCWRLFWTLYRQLGADLVEDEGRRVVMDKAATEEVLAYLRGLVADRLVPPGVDGETGGAITLLTSGSAGFLIDGEWQLLAVRGALGEKFDMRTFPRLFHDGPYACAADSHAFILPKASSEAAQRPELALGFAASMVDDSLSWAKGGHIPASLRVRNSTAYRKLEPQSHYADAAAGAAYDPTAWYSGADSQLYRVFGNILTAVFGGRTTPKSGAAQMYAGLKDLAETEAPV